MSMRSGRDEQYPIRRQRKNVRSASSSVTPQTTFGNWSGW
jgi:hypothetical protein